MTQDEFVAAIKLVVREQAVEGTLDVISSPPGRKVLPEEKSRSEWFNRLDEKQKVYIREIVIEAVDDALFGLLCVIDGVRAIEKSGVKGKLKLIYESAEGEELVLNSSEEEYLHDLYN